MQVLIVVASKQYIVKKKKRNSKGGYKIPIIPNFKITDMFKQSINLKSKRTPEEKPGSKKKGDV
jgi:hypothetical protein